MSNIRIAFFDAKDYDRDSFIKANNKNEYDITYFETRLSEDTVRLADDMMLFVYLLMMILIKKLLIS